MQQRFELRKRQMMQQCEVKASRFEGYAWAS